MPRTPAIKYADTAFFMTDVVIALVDDDDNVLWKTTFIEEDRPDGLLPRLPPLGTHREQHRVVYDYAVEKGFVRNPESRKADDNAPHA